MYGGTGDVGVYDYCYSDQPSIFNDYGSPPSISSTSNALSFTTGQSLQFGQGSIPPKFTILVRARYSSASNQQRIFQSEGRDWLLGWWSGKVGVAKFETWKTPTNPPLASASQEWHVVVGRNSPEEAPYLAATVWVDGHAVSNGWDGTGGDVLTINYGRLYGESEASDCEVSDVLIYPRWLSDTEIDALLAFFEVFHKREECDGPCKEGYWCTKVGHRFCFVCLFVCLFVFFSLLLFFSTSLLVTETQRRQPANQPASQPASQPQC